MEKIFNADITDTIIINFTDAKIKEQFKLVKTEIHTFLILNMWRFQLEWSILENKLVYYSYVIIIWCFQYDFKQFKLNNNLSWSTFKYFNSIYFNNRLITLKTNYKYIIACELS